MKQQRCLLCGQEYPAGLHIMGCLICFPCEKRLLSSAELPPRGTRLRLMKLYGPQEEATEREKRGGGLPPEVRLGLRPCSRRVQGRLRCLQP